MTTITIEQNDSIKQIAELLRDGPVLVTEGGQPVMAVVPLDEADAEAWLMGQNPELMALVEKAREELKEGKGISLADMRQRLGFGTN